MSRADIYGLSTKGYSAPIKEYAPPSSGDFINPRPNVSFGHDDYAKKNRAWLAREKWDDYVQRFQPKEDELLDAVTGEDLLNQRLSSIKIDNSKAFDSALTSANQMRSRYGVNQSQAEKQYEQRSYGLEMAKANAGAMNKTRVHINDRNMQAVGGSGARQAISAV